MSEDAECGLYCYQYMLFSFHFQNHSLQHYPHPDVGRQFDYSDKVVEAHAKKSKKVAEATEGGNTLLYGLARIPHTQQF